MLTTLIAALALSVVAPAAAPVAPAATATLTPCNPQPSKSLGCYRAERGSAHHAQTRHEAAKAKRALEAEADEASESPRMVSCHPDPSRNRGCLRPAA